MHSNPVAPSLATNAQTKEKSSCLEHPLSTEEHQAQCRQRSVPVPHLKSVSMVLCGSVVRVGQPLARPAHFRWPVLKLGQPVLDVHDP